MDRLNSHVALAHREMGAGEGTAEGRSAQRCRDVGTTGKLEPLWLPPGGEGLCI